MDWRPGVLCLVVLTRVISYADAQPAGSSSGEAAAILNAARDAPGGDKRLSAVKTIVSTGRTPQVQSRPDRVRDPDRAA